MKINNLCQYYIGRKPNKEECDRFVKIFIKKGKFGIINELKNYENFNNIQKTNFNDKQLNDFIQETFIKELNRNPDSNEINFLKKNFNKTHDKKYILNYIKKLYDEKKITEQKRLAEQKRIGEQKRVAEQKRLAEEKRIAEQKRIAKEKRIAEQKRIAEEKRIVEQKRIDEEKRIA